jgi:hypothetical protein
MNACAIDTKALHAENAFQRVMERRQARSFDARRENRPSSPPNTSTKFLRPRSICRRERTSPRFDRSRRISRRAAGTRRFVSDQQFRTTLRSFPLWSDRARRIRRRAAGTRRFVSDQQFRTTLRSFPLWSDRARRIRRRGARTRRIRQRANTSGRRYGRSAPPIATSSPAVMTIHRSSHGRHSLRHARDGATRTPARGFDLEQETKTGRS